MRRGAMVPTLLLLLPVLLLGPAGPATAQDRQSESGPSGEVLTEQYRLGPEDVIEVFVWREPDLSRTVMVRPDGKVSLPLVDEIHAAGKSALEIQDEITRALARYLESPVVSVVVAEINSPTVSVVGEVREAGRYPLRQRTTVLDALALAGGFTEFADRGHVVIVRRGPEGPTRIRVDLGDVLKGKADDVPELQPDDTVYVE